jgi:hypothetical protein
MIFKLYQRTMGAANALSSLLAISKLQNYNRIDEATENAAVNLIVDDAENERMLFADLDAVVEGVGALRDEIARRRGAALISSFDQFKR